MKPILVIATVLITYCCDAQFNRSIEIMPVVNINVVIDGLGYNDAGIGPAIGASFFAKHRLQLFVDAGHDRFFGDKGYEIDDGTGRKTKNARVSYVHAGPQFFFIPRLSGSVTYGPVWHVVSDFDYTVDYGLRYGLSAFLGNNRQVLIRATYTSVRTANLPIRYMSIGLGGRIGSGRKRS
jgi:hypothetical protein